MCWLNLAIKMPLRAFYLVMNFLQLEHEIQELSNSLGIAGKISLKEKLTFDVVWQRKLPEMFYPLRFHTKKIRIFD